MPSLVVITEACKFTKVDSRAQPETSAIAQSQGPDKSDNKFSYKCSPSKCQSRTCRGDV